MNKAKTQDIPTENQIFQSRVGKLFTRGHKKYKQHICRNYIYGMMESIECVSKALSGKTVFLENVSLLIMIGAYFVPEIAQLFT